MTAYNPPEFQFSGLIFNPLIYEQGEATSSSGSSGVFTDVTTDTLYTNNIQGKTAAAATSLYTLSSGIVSLGGSLLTRLDYITDAHFIYNALKDQLVSLRFNLYASNMISMDYYADIVGTTLSSSVRITPQFVGDTTYANGVYSIFAGTTRLLNLIKTSLEAPIHWLYNTAQTQGKSTAFGATTITETYYADTALPTNPTANTQVAVSGFSGANNGDITTACGRYNLNCVSSITLTAPATGFLGAVSSIAISAGGVLGRTYRYGTNNVIERIKADTSQPLLDSGRIDWTPSLTTPTVANTGVYKLSAGDFETTAPISPLYSYVSTGTPTGSIGNILNGTFTGGGLNNNQLHNSGNIASVPAGVYCVSSTICFNCSVAGQIIYQQFSLNDGTNTFAMSGIPTGTAPGNCAVRNYYGHVNGIVALTATATITAQMFLNFSSGTYTQTGNTFNLRAVRIA